MHVDRLTLTNYRNYARLDFEAPSDIVILQGDNAQGKTNFLEAIHLLATTRSPRAGSDRELINWLAFEDVLPFARVTAKVRRGSGFSQVEMTATKGDGEAGISKRFRVNGAPKRAVDVIGLINVVLFSPLDIELIAGSPAQRRRYLDIMNSQVDGHYLRALQQYNRVLAQRNALLRLIRDRQARSDQLGYWNEQLVDLGARLVAARRDTVSAVQEAVQEIHPVLTGRQEVLQVTYQTNCCTDVGIIENGSLVQAFNEAVKAAEPREIAQGVSLVGPHRDDLSFTTDGADTTVYGSRGQQRTAALALKLAETRFIHDRTNEQPILLLDDVMSELDSRRRRQVVASIQPGQQVVLTATDLDDFEAEFLNRAHIFQVKAGTIVRLR